MSTSAEIVNYLIRHYLAEQDEDNKNVRAARVDDLIRQMGDFLQTRLEEDTPHQTIWDSFRQAPQENAPLLIGILEALFEAQPAVKERVDGFMRAVTVIEAKKSDLQLSQNTIEDSLKSDPNGLITKQTDDTAALADQPAKKNPPAYLYNNEREGFESDRQNPVTEPFMVGENAQIVYVPAQKAQFPFMFMHLGRLTETSEDLTTQEKQIVQRDIQEIRDQLAADKPFNDAKMAKAFEEIWEIAPSYANALIESLQENIDQLPVETQDFIIQLHSPLH